MKTFLNPRWLLLINTIPILILALLLYGQYSIIESLLEEENRNWWKKMSAILGGIWLLNLSYTLFLIFKKRQVHALYGLLSLLVYIPFLYLYNYYFDDLLPFSIPSWMITENSILYAGTFIMPTLIYALFILVLRFTSENREHKVWVNLLISISIPLLTYLFTQILLPLWRNVSSTYQTHIFYILIITFTLLFLFFLLRGIYILMIKKSKAFGRFELFWKIPITIIFPVLGLLVNQGFLIGSYSPNSGIFGNFNSSWFIVLAIINGVSICMPNIEKNKYRILLFLFRSTTFSYTLYFFIVFLPFLPISIVAIILFGLGFLMLTPLILFPIHVNELSKDYQYLTRFYKKRMVAGISILSFLIIPLGITFSYWKDKSVLNETLSYLYSPDYTKQYKIDANSIEKTIQEINNRIRPGSIFFENGTPYLTSYYKWLVLDNLTLSERKIKDIENIFLGKNENPQNSSQELRGNRNRLVKISKIDTKSTYDEKRKYWRTWVNLELTNTDKSSNLNEYSTDIYLPEGCWISDYYLYVLDKKEFGLLAEKKSAMWVYSNIVNQNRDPGILYYKSGNKVSFKVFPFAKEEKRKTGIEFIHKEPITLNIDENYINAGDSINESEGLVETNQYVYLSSAIKKKLNTVQRPPYFHFLIDVSKENQNNITDYIRRIDQFLQTNPKYNKANKISFVNAYTKTMLLDDQWKSTLMDYPLEGGFYLERGIKMALLEAYKNKENVALVVVTDSMDKAVIQGDFSDFKFSFPENNYFYQLQQNGVLIPHSLMESPKLPRDVKFDCQFCETVLEYTSSENEKVFLPNNDQPSIFLKRDSFSISDIPVQEKDWESGLGLQAAWLSQTIHPEIAEDLWLPMVKSSFLTKIMTPSTSYLVVENEAQKAVLRNKQKLVLAGNKNLDLNDDTQQMSEPSWWIVVLLFGVYLWRRQKKMA